MKQLERIIYECAMDILPQAREKVQKISTQARYIEIPFICEGCYDKVIFDTKIREFVKIRYLKGKGAGIHLEGMSDFVGYFNETEICEIKLPC